MTMTQVRPSQTLLAIRSLPLTQWPFRADSFSLAGHRLNDMLSRRRRPIRRLREKGPPHGGKRRKASRYRQDLFQEAIAYFAATAAQALWITSSTACGCESIGTWLLFSSTVVAPMRLAQNRCRSGWTARSSAAPMYQVGFVRQPIPSSFWPNKSAAGG